MSEARTNEAGAIRRSDLPHTAYGRFWARVQKGGGGGCWTWTGATMRRYGRISIGKRTVRAHRMAFALAHGEAPAGMLVCHHCDNPLCVRPDHLFLGTDADNVADRGAKGRTARGDANGSRRHPERLARGDANGQRRHPERTARGDMSPRRKHPERYPRGSASPTAKITEADVRAMRRLWTGGTSQLALARRFGLSKNQAWNIINGRSWKHVT